MLPQSHVRSLSQSHFEVADRSGAIFHLGRYHNPFDNMQRADILPQKLHTNVSVVKMKKGGCRFEIACYRNSVLAWRDKMYASAQHARTARWPGSECVRMWASARSRGLTRGDACARLCCAISTFPRCHGA